MPRKTRKEKIAAAGRKKQFLTQSVSREEKQPKSESEKSPSKQLINTEQEITKRYFLTDFRKSILYITIIFAIEILLYSASMSNYVLNFLKIK